MSRDEVLEDSYRVLAEGKHDKNGSKEFGTVMRLASEKISNPIFKEENIFSERQEHPIRDLYPLADRKDTIRETVQNSTEAQNTPVIILGYEGKDYLLDGNNRVRYWYSKGDMLKNLRVNYHQIR